MSSKHTTVQGQAWDQVALRHYDSEKRMHVLLPANVEEMDTLLFAGDTNLHIPAVEARPLVSLRPWERM